MSAPFWDPRSDADHRAMAQLLAPLVVASQNRNFISPEAAKAQTYTWRLTLADVPPAILEEAIGRIVLRGITWMPKPGEVKDECAKVLAEKRKAAMVLHLGHCDHSSHYEEFTDRNGVTRTRRCACWRRALTAADQVGLPIQAPARELAERSE
jgi:hypothetical protein